MPQFYLLFLCSIIFFKTLGQVSVIPEPNRIQSKKGIFKLTKTTAIHYNDEALDDAVNFFSDYLNKFYQIKIDSSKTGNNTIRIKRDSLIQGIGPEGYKLTIKKNKIELTGKSAQGVFYGIQTLIQLLPINKTLAETIEIPAVDIIDEPRFAYRGLHIDVGRHYFPVSFIKKYIDYIALHKLNYFHWHLTEDQGWRIEIKKYPKLTEVGACRNGTMIGKLPGTGNDSLEYCHYYTQEEIKEVVQYAADRYITIIPEIEMPGHSSAALASYPYLGCPKTGPYQVEQGWGVFEDVYCAGNDSVYTFLEDILKEVFLLFPSTYIHIGGDESPKKNWRQCPKCQNKIKNEGLKDVYQLQSYFIKRMERFINSHGRTIIGWDEILLGGLAPNAVVMSWRGEKGGIDAAKQQHQVIMTPGDFVYLDHAQAKNEDSLTNGGYLPLEKVYLYDPMPKELKAEEQKYILGSQANVWTEYMGSPPKVEYMVFPRLSALSEVLWTQPVYKSWTKFQKKMNIQFKRYELWKVNYKKE